MTAPVEFGLAPSNSYPSGTGSYNYDGSFKIVVQNLAFNKQVSIWAQVGATWKDIYASHVQSLPGNLELWSAPGSNSAQMSCSTRKNIPGRNGENRSRSDLLKLSW